MIIILFLYFNHSYTEFFAEFEIGTSLSLLPFPLIKKSSEFLLIAVKGRVTSSLTLNPVPYISSSNVLFLILLIIFLSAIFDEFNNKLISLMDNVSGNLFTYFGDFNLIQGFLFIHFSSIANLKKCL